MNSEVSYEIKLNFESGAINPSRIFSSLAKIIDSVRRTDYILSKSINCNVKTIQILDEIRPGSVVTRIKEFIEVEDSAFNNLDSNKKIENYLNSSKIEILKVLANGVVDSETDIEALSNSIEEIANKENLNNIYGFSKPNTIELLDSLNEIADSTTELINGESIDYCSNNETSVKLMPNTKVYVDKIKEEMIEKILESDRIIILKIKKPDYLGLSKWEFKHKANKIDAKVQDDLWMQQFHNKEVVIGPGDALEVGMHTIESYDNKGNLLFSEHIINKVYRIISNGDFYES